MTEDSILMLPPDARGRIYRCCIEGVCFNIIFTKAGFARSGDFHPTAQHDFNISGEWRLKIGSSVAYLSDGQYLRIPPNTPHLFYCIRDSVMIEWWSGVFSATYDVSLRREVDAINKAATVHDAANCDYCMGRK